MTGRRKENALPRWWVAVLCLTLLCQGSGARAAAPEDWMSEWELPDGFRLQIDAEGFDHPTAIAFVPNPGPDPKSPLYFVTELRGKVKVVTRDRSIITFSANYSPIIPPKELPDPDGETGMAAITLDPKHGYVFVSFAYPGAGRILRNGMVRFDSTPGVFGTNAIRATSFSALFKDDISRITHQIGSMILDGETLLIGVGDGGQHLKSHNLDSTLGKILRMTLDGKPLPDNPHYEDDDAARVRNFVWASGLRNPFGLAQVNGRLFASENGFDMDRFLELRRGENYGWDGTDWSIGMNVPIVFHPTTAPVHVAWMPAENPLFPPEYRSRFFVVMAGGKSLQAGITTIDYDFARARLGSRPRQFLLHLAERHRELDPVGIALGPDGLYVACLYPVRTGKSARGAILRITHEPGRTNDVTHALNRDDRAQLLMLQKGCYSCHGQRPADLHVAPPLDRETLVPRILSRLRSEDYRVIVEEIDDLQIEPYKSFKRARGEVLAAKGMEQARLWIKYHVLEPTFDRKNSAMPNLGLKEDEARDIADYLMRRNVGDIGVSGFIRSLAQPYLLGPVKRRHLIGAFTMGFGLAFGLFMTRRAWRRLRRRRWARSHPTHMEPESDLAGKMQ